jgi:hypothetical protein
MWMVTKPRPQILMATGQLQDFFILVFIGADRDPACHARFNTAGQNIVDLVL